MSFELKVYACQTEIHYDKRDVLRVDLCSISATCVRGLLLEDAGVESFEDCCFVITGISTARMVQWCRTEDHNDEVVGYLSACGRVESLPSCTEITTD